jgi:hypothetical protein
MLKKVLVFSGLLALTSTPALAQIQAEASATIGWTFSDGVSFSASPINGVTYSRIDPKDGLSFGLTFGVYVSPQSELEFRYNRQSTHYEVTGTGSGTTLVASSDTHIDNYHGNYVYNFGEPDMHTRPYFLIGLGATSFGDATFPTHTVTGLSRFSWDLGLGVKVYPSKNVGVKAGVNWVPTYIKTDQTGWWCDPFWGCAPVGNVQYANQWELAGGVTFKF